MTSPILVTGGTGTLGRHVVTLLREAGREVRVLSRHEGAAEPGVEYVVCDLMAGEGLDAALAGVDTVVHLAGGPRGDDAATARLVAAARGAGVGHLVYISVIGADTVPVGWLRMKLAAEEAIAASGIPFTILRAAQFHDLVLTVARKMAKLPVLPAPGGLASSRSTPETWRRGSWSSPWPRRRGWWPTSPGRRSIRWPSSTARICGPAASTG
jgi:uncharacterized protein YbjT (DUF2867 family)